MFDLKHIVREHIQRLKPYSSARDEFQGDASVFLDANENPYNAPFNRYPDPRQRALKEVISRIKGVSSDCLFLGNGSDEPIDLIIRACCTPGVDNIVAIDPTYGMYAVAADVNAVEYRRVPLDAHYQFQAGALLQACDHNTKLIFLCSPNNPTGNSLCAGEIQSLLDRFEGIVVLDEAYIDFSSGPGWVSRLTAYPNLLILQTFSKAWGMAGIRLGMAMGTPELIAILNKIKYPYNVNILTQQTAMQALADTRSRSEWLRTILEERQRLSEAMKNLPAVLEVYPTDANFFLIRTVNANQIYAYLVEKGIIVRNRSSVSLCGQCLRITVGSPGENHALLDALSAYPVAPNS
jgi:histidinol-phosphate aminotransferase